MPLVRKGAEANLYLEDWYGLKVILKRRVPKAYRIPQIDSELRHTRTVHESQLMHDAKLTGVPTPTIYMVDTANATIVMQHIGGRRVKEALDVLTSEERQRLCRRLGRSIGRLHRRGIVHGDLTTSNMIVTPGGRIFFIDFGLGDYSKEVEERGVDLLLMKRALQSTHYGYAKECFDAVIEGYAQEMGRETAEEVTKRVREIARRGRYVAER